MASGVRIELTHVDLESSSPSLGTWPDIKIVGVVGIEPTKKPVFETGPATYR